MAKPTKAKRGRGGPPFIDREVFTSLLDGIPNLSGKPYKKDGTIYRDLSRLVVAWIATADETQLKKLYNELKWKGKPNIVPIQKCAKEWFAQHQPGRLPTK